MKENGFLNKNFSNNNYTRSYKGEIFLFEPMDVLLYFFFTFTLIETLIDNSDWLPSYLTYIRW